MTLPTAERPAPPAPARGLDLAGAALAGVDLSGRDIVRIDLQNAVLAAALLADTRAHGARLRQADLRGLRGRGLRCRDGDLERALLDDADLTDADLRRAVLLEASLRGADLRRADLRGADLRGADLRDARLDGALLDGADLTAARLTGASVVGAHAPGACLNRALDDGTGAVVGLLDAGGYAGLPLALVRAGALTGAVGRRAVRTVQAVQLRGRATGGEARGEVAEKARGIVSELQERAAAGRARREREREGSNARREARLASIRARREAIEAERVADKEAQAQAARARAAERAARRERRRMLRGGPVRPSEPPPAAVPTLRSEVAPRPRPIVERRAAEQAAVAASEALLRARARAGRTAAARRAEEARRIADAAATATREIAEREAAAIAAAEAHRLAEEQAIADAAVRRVAAEQARRDAEQRALAEARRRQEEEDARRRAAEQARRDAEAEARRREEAARERRRREVAAFAARPDRVAAARRREAVALRTRARPVPSPVDRPNVLAPSHSPVPTALVPGERDRLGRLAKLLQREAARQHEGDEALAPGGDLTGRDLRGRRMRDARLHGAILRDARLDAARLEGSDLREADLRGASLEGARLDRCVLDRVQAAGARLDGARLRDAALAGADLTGARLVDADLRGADLSGADLSGADLTGADLRRADLSGARLAGANLTAARLSDLDLGGAVLDEAVLDQADLAGVRWEGASVRGADLAGALGLSARDRERLATLGARAADPGLEALLGRFAPKQLRVAAAILALGFGTWLAARYLADGGLDAATLESAAEVLRSTDPLEASAAYERLAEDALRIDDKVGYLVEAASLAAAGGDATRADTLFDEALAAAATAPGLDAEVRLVMGAWQVDQERWLPAEETLTPLLSTEGHPAETRARAVVLVGAARAGRGEAAPAPAVEALFTALAAVPEAEADLRVALAELRAVRGEPDLALEQLDRAAALSLPADLARRVQETRAHVLDQAGRDEEAAALWASLMAEAAEGEPDWLAARLALADLRQRQGQPEAAAALVEALTADGVESGIRGRALLVKGRLAEQREDIEGAARAYQGILTLASVDPDTTEEARLSLARVVLDGGGGDPEAALAGLPPDAAAGILVHARLGEARRRLDAGDASGALDVYEQLEEGSADAPEVLRAARAGRAEALSQLGELDAAVELWRGLLASDPSPAERLDIELQLAHGLLQGGDAGEAAAAFRSLSERDDPDLRLQGLLGLAEVARAQGEAERARGLYRQVADQSPDPAYRVQALQELGDLASEQGRPEAALEAWRALIAAAAPGSAAGASARLAVVLTLADLGRVDEALGACQEAAATATDDRARAQAGLACGELLEKARRPAEAAVRYSALLALGSAPADLRADAWLGLSRAHATAGDAEAAWAATEAGLAELEAPSLRLPLLSAQVQALRQLDRPAALATALAARDALAEEVPALAGPLLVDAAATARGRGAPEEAIELLERAVTLPLSPAERAGALVELGDTLLEAGRLTPALARFEEAAAVDGVDEMTAFSAGMGRAEVLKRTGELAGALAALQDLDPPGEDTQRWWLETRARWYAEAGQDDAALAAWGRLADAASEAPGAHSSALRGEADLLLGRDEPALALERYDAAARLAPEAAGVGWATLGGAEALIALDRPEEARTRLDRLLAHPDPEVALQARLRLARMRIDEEAWADALTLLADVRAGDLGPGWDASAVELVALAHSGAGDAAAAAGAWAALAERWPASNEAVLPAWLGLADLARQQGDVATARDWASRALERADDPGYRQQAEELVAQLRR